jgi:hypothetical protein
VKLVYVAGKFSAPTRAQVEINIDYAVDVGLAVAQMGAFPVVPHANTAHPGYEKLQPYPFWIAGTLALLRRCDALITVPNWKESSGARGEVADALERGQPVFHLLDDLRAWLSVPAALVLAETLRPSAPTFESCNGCAPTCPIPVCRCACHFSGREPMPTLVPCEECGQPVTQSIGDAPVCMACRQRGFPR